MPRTFLTRDGRTVTLPQGLQAGAGATNMRLHPGAVVTLEDDKCVEYSRFINGRLRAEDLVEIDPKDAPKTPVEHELLADPNKASTGRVHLETGTPGKKG